MRSASCVCPLGSVFREMAYHDTRHSGNYCDDHCSLCSAESSFCTTAKSRLGVDIINWLDFTLTWPIDRSTRVDSVDRLDSAENRSTRSTDSIDRLDRFQGLLLIIWQTLWTPDYIVFVAKNVCILHFKGSIFQSINYFNGAANRYYLLNSNKTYLIIL